MGGLHVAHAKRSASVRASGSEVLRLEWIQARAADPSLRQLLSPIARYLDRGFSIPEIDAYIAEQLACAQDRLQRAERDGSMTARRLRLLEGTLELALAAGARHARPGHDPILAEALALATELEETSRS